MAPKSIGSFIDENTAFETWLGRQCTIDETGLEQKHEKMSEDPFPFLRATYFRWATTIERLCPELRTAPKVLAVGDIHIENFGTWRNVEQRLVWGINDFDEAAHMPYAFDLVRLVTSARLAPGKRVGPKTVARAILQGYRLGLQHPGPTLLDQHQTWMNRFLCTTEDERRDFREEMDKLKCKEGLAENDVPPSARDGLIEEMPKGLAPEYAKRRKGVGSLGRPRYVAFADWHGGLVVREAKAQVPSAWDWAHGRPDAASRLIEAARSKSRSPDPYLEANGQFVFRRLAADADKIGIDMLDEEALQANLFGAMGIDLGAFHGRNRAEAQAIQKDLARRNGNWLLHAAEEAEEQVLRDYKEWEDANPKKKKKNKRKKEKKKKKGTCWAI